MAIEVGRRAPDFTLKDTAGEPVTLSSFHGRKNVVLVFYPTAFSAFCTTQLRAIGENEARYTEGEAQVIGVSVDSHHSQARFAEDLGLTDTILLADFHPRGAVADAYGVYLPDWGTAARATFVIDKAGVIRARHLTDTPLTIPDQDDYFATLAACAA
jgi:mycoredoxin-dependent peroxiredoxin